MSSTIFNETNSFGNDENSRYFVVNRKQQENLAGFVQRVRSEKNFSLKDVERNSHNQIAASYVNKIENGFADADGVTPLKLKALARGLQVSEDEIFAVARGVNGEEPSTLEQEVSVLFYGWENASDEDKAATLEAIRMIAEGFQRRRARKKK